MARHGSFVVLALLLFGSMRLMTGVSLLPPSPPGTTLQRDVHKQRLAKIPDFHLNCQIKHTDRFVSKLSH